MVKKILYYELSENKNSKWLICQEIETKSNVIKY